MKFDDYGVAYLTSDNVCELLYKNSRISLDGISLDDPTQYNNAVKHFYLDTPLLRQYHTLRDISIEDFDSKNISNWYMPEEYKQLNIVDYLVGLCKSEVELERVAEELLLYEERNLFDLLRFLKYMVATFQDGNVVYGIGRGSSVASYVLYLIGVHKINSIAYDLDIKEFLK